MTRKTPAAARPRQDKLQPRREPAQERSRQMLRRILDAALVVLKRDGIEGFTNNHVAAEAGISIASVYQFFPNKLAIIYRLYQDWLHEVAGRLTHAASEAHDAQDWRTFAARLSETLSGEVVDADAEYELLRAMWSHRELLELDHQHSMALGEVVADQLRAYGSTWPRQRLVKLAVFANELHTLAAELAVLGTRDEKRVLNEFAQVAYLALWQHALSDAGGSKPEAAVTRMARRRQRTAVRSHRGNAGS